MQQFAINSMISLRLPAALALAVANVLVILGD